MMDRKHTPGPWEVDPTEQHAHLGGERIFKVCKTGFGGGLIADVSAWWVDPKSAEANARLIAAAPELAEALRDAEFLMRKAAINPKEAYSMVDSFKRSAEAARAALKAAGLD